MKLEKNCNNCEHDDKGTWESPCIECSDDNLLWKPCASLLRAELDTLRKALDHSGAWCVPSSENCDAQNEIDGCELCGMVVSRFGGQLLKDSKERLP